jgi:hypothetical protein
VFFTVRLSLLPPIKLLQSTAPREKEALPSERSPTGAPKQRGRKRRIVRLACLPSRCVPAHLARSIRYCSNWIVEGNLPIHHGCDFGNGRLYDAR